MRIHFLFFHVSMSWNLLNQNICSCVACIFTCQHIILLLHHFVWFMFLQEVIGCSQGLINKILQLLGGLPIAIALPFLSVHLLTCPFMSFQFLSCPFPFMYFHFLVMSIVSFHVFLRWKDIPSPKAIFLSCEALNWKSLFGPWVGRARAFFERNPKTWFVRG